MIKYCYTAGNELQQGRNLGISLDYLNLSSALQPEFSLLINSHLILAIFYISVLKQFKHASSTV